MALVLTSNVGDLDGNDPLGQGLNLPFQYHNYLSQPLELEPNSEVAVQSVKVVKNGNVSLDRDNNTFYVYTGKNGSESKTDGNQDMSKTTGVPRLTIMNSDKRQTLNVENLADKIVEGLNISIGDPCFLKSQMNTSGIEVVVKRATSGAFEGYEIKLNLNTSASNTDIKGSTDNLFLNLFNEDPVSSNQFFKHTYDKSTGILKTTYTDKERLEVVGKVPISRVGGEFSVSFIDAWNNDGDDNDVNTGEETSWAIGISRYIDTDTTESQYTNIDDPDYRDINPPYYLGNVDGENVPFYDYVAKSIYDDDTGKWHLRLFHTIYDPDETMPDGSDAIVETEFKYWEVGPSSASLSAPIELFQTNASYGTGNVSQITFKLENERVSVLVQSADGSASYTLANGSQANKTHNLKPICLNNYSIYPRFMMSNANLEAAVDAASKAEFIIKKYNGISIDADNIEPDYLEQLEDKTNEERKTYDWFASQIFYGNQNGQAKEIDTRYMFKYNDATAYNQLGVNASASINASVVLITAPDLYFQPTLRANAQQLLGFERNPIPVPAADTAILKQFTSSSTPKLISKDSLFVRLDNFNSESYNGQMNGPSKMLYHLPKFDASGLETGALFFEPAEKTYVKLNNTTKLAINDFDISLVNANETLADNLTGKTIVMLHFRKSRM